MFVFAENLCITGALDAVEIERAARDRARAIFDETIVWYDTFNADGYGGEKLTPEPFALNPSLFLAGARRSRPLHPEATVSAFTSWIYSLYQREDPDPKSLSEGIAAERAIFAEHKRSSLARAVISASDPTHLSRPDGNWLLLHNGLNLGGATSHAAPIAIDHLHVNGDPLRASPDLAFINESTGHVLLVEIKFSRKRIPSNLWPNVWAQLWCYSQIPAARTASGVTAIGEVWGGRSELVKGYDYTTGQRTRKIVPKVYLRKTVRRDPRVDGFHRFFSTLFDIYRGEDRSE
jgi:hypothetical protein